MSFSPWPNSRSSWVDALPVGQRIVASHIQHVDEDGRALDVPEELMTEADTGRRTLDQPGHVRRDERVVAERDDPEFRPERGERVGGNLRVGAAPGAQQR